MVAKLLTSLLFKLDIMALRILLHDTYITVMYLKLLQAVNSLELAMDAMTHIQKRFYEDFPPHPDESKYLFATPSTMKPTQIKVH